MFTYLQLVLCRLHGVDDDMSWYVLFVDVVMILVTWVTVIYPSVRDDSQVESTHTIYM